MGHTDFIANLINIYDSILCPAREIHLARADHIVINRLRQTLRVLVQFATHLQCLGWTRASLNSTLITMGFTDRKFNITAITVPGE